MKTNKLKKEISNHINVLLGKVKPTDLKRWVLAEERQPVDEGYYIILRGDSNPHFIHNCKPGVHFWYADKKEWSSETTYWMEDVQTENKESKCES